MFLYNYHIETHYQSPGFEPTSLVVYHDFYGRASNVFLYGRGTENRTLINRLKAYYFTVKLYLHMVPPLRFELRLLGLRVRYATVTS